MRASRFLLGAVLGLSVLGCKRTETEEQILHVYDPYAGEPVYPNRRPTFELPAGDVGLVSNNGSDTLSVLDLVNGKVLGSAPVGRNPVDIDGPHHVAWDRAAGFAYVALAYPVPSIVPGPHAAHGSSQRDGFVQKLSLDDLRILGEVRVDRNPGDIVLSDDGKRIAVSHFDLAKALAPDTALEDRRATLAVIDPTKVLPVGSPDATRITTCVAPHGVALSRPDGARAYVACYGEDSIAVVDLTKPSAPVTLVPVGTSPSNVGQPKYGPYAAVMSPTGNVLAVSNTESKDVRFFDTGSASMKSLVITTMGAPYFAAWSSDEQHLFIPTQGPDMILMADAVTGNVIASRTFDGQTCKLPHEAVLGSDGSTLYVVCEGDHTAPSNVLVLDPLTLSTKATLPVGVYPDRLAIVGAP